MGNPPWLTYNHASSSYQNFLKEEITDYGLLGKSESSLITHMELATLFFVKTVDLYLKEGGTIEFVMPRGIFTGDQHSNFRKTGFKVEVGLSRIKDLDEVKPLFNINACVVRGEKGNKTKRPVPGEKLSGTLPRKNASLEDAQETLDKKEKQYYLNLAGDRTFLSESDEQKLTGSHYKDKLNQGATLVPRNLWFVQVEEHPQFGINPKEPFIKTSKKAIKYSKYRDIRMEGKIEPRFLHATLRGSEIVPFTHLSFLAMVLPVIKRQAGFKTITREIARNKGYSNLLNWLNKAQSKWEKLRGDKADQHTAVEWLNYRNKVVKQNPEYRFKVLYLTSGKHIAASIIDMEEENLVVNSHPEISLNDFIAGSTTYYYGTDDKNEAYFLGAFLNSPKVDELIKNLQSKGLFGERHIHKKVLELPIPQYNPDNKTHIKLAKIGKECEKKAKKLLPKWTEKYKSIGHIRKGIKEDMSEKLENITELTSKALKSSQGA